MMKITKAPKYSVRITNIAGNSSYLTHRDRTNWCKQTALKHTKEFKASKVFKQTHKPGTTVTIELADQCKMGRLLRYFKTLCNNKQENSYSKALLTRQLFQKYQGRKSVLEIREYVNTLKPEEIERLINNKKE